MQRGPFSPTALVLTTRCVGITAKHEVKGVLQRMKLTAKAADGTMVTNACNCKCERQQPSEEVAAARMVYL